MTTLATVRRTIKEAWKDNCLGMAAQLAFYFFLALFPALLVLVTLLAYFPIDGALAELTQALGAIAPAELLGLLQGQLDQLRAGPHQGIITFGVVAAFWSSSAATFAMIDAANRAYKVVDHRPWWKRQLLALTLTLALAVFVLLALAILLAGPVVTAWLAGRLGFGYLFVLTWQIVRWPLVVLVAVFGIDLLYYFAPGVRLRWNWLSPGAALATGLWIGSSLGFRFYIVSLHSLSNAYGAIASVIVVLIWFYLSGLAIVVGAELNGVLQEGRRAPAVEPP